MNKIDIAGLNVDSTTKQQFLNAALTRIKNGQKTFVITPYSEFLYNTFQDPKLLDIFNEADFSLADGIGIFWAKKYLEIPLTAKSYWGKILQAAWQMKYSLAAIIFNPRWVKSALPEKIVGADLVWDLAKMAVDNNLSIFLLGGFGNTAELASRKVIDFLGRENQSLSDSRKNQIFWSNKNPEDLSIIDDINKAAPDILLVAYGPIKQEKWIAENLSKLNVKLAIGLGGTFDYIAGKKSVPPKFIRYSGLEWLWRFITQPYRFKRIINATFGLMSGLWHYKVFHALPLRPNVVIAIINQKNKILVCERNPKGYHVDIVINTVSLKKLGYWQFPQGGIDPGEELVEAAKREAQEETGLKNLDLIKISQKTYTYIWNNALRKFWKNKNKRNKGQYQHIAYFKFNGIDKDVHVDFSEFINYKWIDLSQLLTTIHPERLPVAKIVMEDLTPLEF